MSMEYDSGKELTTSDILMQLLADEEDGEESTKDFFKSEFLVSAVDALFHARREAGLTQAQIADLLHTKQASIARMEADTTGSMTLRRYAEVALACGMVPLPITLVPVDVARQYALENPGVPVSADAYTLWHKNHLLQQNVMHDLSQSMSNLSSILPESLNAISNWAQQVADLFLQSSQVVLPKVKAEPLTLSQPNLQSSVAEPLKLSIKQTTSKQTTSLGKGEVAA